MSASILAEALARIEHKIDFLLALERRKNPLLQIPPVKELSHECPVCRQQVQYVIDVIKNVLVRKCGCSTGKQAMIQLTPVNQEETRYGTGRDDQEDGSDSDIRGRRRGRPGPTGAR